MLSRFKIIVEKHPDGYVAYPLGLKGIVVVGTLLGRRYVADMATTRRDYATMGGKSQSQVKARE